MEKRCIKCGKAYPATRFPKNGHAADGSQMYYKQCSDCWNANLRQRKADLKRRKIEHPEEFAPLPEGQKRCPKCKAVQLIEEFWLKGGGHGDERSGHCRTCVKAYRSLPRVRKRKGERDRAYQANLSPAKKQQQRTRLRIRYRHTKETQPELLQERSQRYLNANREKVRERNRKWAKKNRMKFRQYWQKYHARKVAAQIGEVSYDQILKRDGHWCYLCELVVDAEDVGFDHVIPLSRGGAHSEENIRVVHQICNSRKRDRLVGELRWVANRGK